MDVLSLELPTATRRPGRRGRAGEATAARVAIGTFDGVHLGHRQVLHGCDTVLTFDPHPLQVIAPANVPSLLSDRRLKLHKLDALGIERVAVVPFDRSWSRVTAEEFVERVVIDQLDAGSVSVGEGFRFGARGVGTTATFERYSDLRTRVVPLVTRGGTGETISSSRIRRLVSDGEIEEAAVLLGTPLTLPAERGHDGALLIGAEYVWPAPGLYAGTLDRNACALRVGPDGEVEVLGAASSANQVQVSFLRRVAS